MNPTGTVLAICTGAGGIPKFPVGEAQLGPLGFEGDRHNIPEHGGADRAVCLFAWEDYEKLKAAGVPADSPGTFGENILTQGLKYDALRPGDQLLLSGGSVLEIWDVREPCATLQQLDPRFPDLLIGRSGFLCRVVKGGKLSPGQQISLGVTRTEGEPHPSRS